MRTYYMLTKPGIILGNLITTVGGFALASRGVIDFGLFIAMFLGLGLIIASACVCNNAIDRKADEKMARTKNRPLPQGLISPRSALVFALVLGALGTAILARYTSLLTLLVALAGFFFYVVMYSIWKYRSSAGTLVGSISGAMPPVVGYCAAGGQLDVGAFLLFALLVLWQMPHFYSIAIYRCHEYASASIPVLPVVRGMYVTKLHMLFYILAFLATLPLLLTFHYAGYVYLITASLLGTLWLLLCIRGFKAGNDQLWARTMFRFSLLVITALSLLISLDTL